MSFRIVNLFCWTSTSRFYNHQFKPGTFLSVLVSPLFPSLSKCVSCLVSTSFVLTSLWLLMCFPLHSSLRASVGVWKSIRVCIQMSEWVSSSKQAAETSHITTVEAHRPDGSLLAVDGPEQMSRQLRSLRPGLRERHHATCVRAKTTTTTTTAPGHD